MATKLSGARVVASLCCCLLLAAVVAAGGKPASSAAAAADLFERTVFELVNAAIRGNSTVKGDPRVGPALIRLLFHDCWVNGCDGSVLLDETPGDGTRTEKAAAKNVGLGGFDLIDRIKASLSASGDSAASCADILAFGARDAASVLSGGRIRYAVSRGRGDGVASSAAAADAALPSPAPPRGFADLADSFAARGLGKADLAALSGAHALGVSHSASFAARLDASVAAAGQINGTYQLALLVAARRQRRQNETSEAAGAEATTATEIISNNVRDMGPAFRAACGYSGVGVDTAATGALDNSYYTATLQNMVLLRSDWELTQDEDTLARLVMYRDDADRWRRDFAAAMERLSGLRPPEGARLEVRDNCRRTNGGPAAMSHGRAALHAVKSFLQRRCDQMHTSLLRFFNGAGLLFV